MWKKIQIKKATGDLIGNKTTDKKLFAGKTKSKKDNKANKLQEIYIPPEKCQQIIDGLRLF